jgi:23S rRNA pseudouridine2605 synthase
VRVDGVPATLGVSVDPERQRVEVDGRPIRMARPDYWLVNKPRGVLSTVRDPERRPTVVQLLPAGLGRLFPVGRLDRDTEGLVLLTNDGEIAQALLHPSYGNEREYRVVVRGAMVAQALKQLERGVELEEGVTAPARVDHIERRADSTRFHLTLREGRKRQIRRSLAALGHPVLRLVRVRMGPLRLVDLPSGAARRLTPAERRQLRHHIRRLAGAHPSVMQPAGRRVRQPREKR